MDEEPVGYLGGSVEDDPYAEPYADKGGGADPYGGDHADSAPGSDDEEVVGMLGGAAGDEELPALGPAPGDGSYAASDFIEGDETYADPYADPYSQDGEYDDPYALPPSQEDTFGDYEGYDAGEGDPSYFDSMGHDDGYGPDEVETQSADDFTQYDDDSSPKTISQQDAESIIRRITTKRILPPDQDQGKSVAPRQLTPTGGGLRIWPILIAVLLLGAGGVAMFTQEIAEMFPELAPLLGVTLETDKGPEVVNVEPKEVKRKRLMLEKVLNSEAKAFGMEKAEYKKLKKKVEAAAKADAPRRRRRSSMPDEPDESNEPNEGGE
jgi:hypothetical protein